MKIFIGNVAPEATSSDLRKVFEGTGLEIQKCDKVVLAAISDILRMPKLIMMVTYRVIFLTGPPLEMSPQKSLDWPPSKSSKYENH